MSYHNHIPKALTLLKDDLSRYSSAKDSFRLHHNSLFYMAPQNYQ